MRGFLRGSSAETAEIAIDWQGLMDGRPHRVRRGKDFGCSVAEFNEAAREAAEIAGKQLLATRDRMKPRQFAWVQFADAEILEGTACLCGSTLLDRVGVALASCQGCQRTLLIARAGAVEAPRKKRRRTESVLDYGQTGKTLADFSDIRLECYATSDSERRLVGFGIGDDQRLTLLLVSMPIVAGAPVPDGASPLDSVHEVVFAKPFPGAADLADRPEWDSEWAIVL